MGASSESDVEEAYVNSRLDANHRITVMDMRYFQSETTIEMDNTTAHGVLTKQLTPKRSKAIDMQFCWLRDRNNQNQFHLNCKPGIKNLTYYYSKYHPLAHHC